MTSTLANEFSAAAKKVGKTAEALAKALVFKLPFHFLGLAIILIIIGVGKLLEVVRVWTIVRLAPEAAHHTKAFAIVADATLDILNLLRTTVQTIEWIVQSIEHLFNHNVAVTVIPSFKLAKVSTAQVIDATMRVQACSTFSAPDAISYILKHAASDTVCPVLRSIKPIPYVNSTIPLLSWLSYDPTPYPEGNNCEPTEYVYGVEPELCAALQTGGIMLEVVLPLAATALVLMVAGKQLFRFLAAVLWLVVVQIKTLASWLQKLAKAL